MNRQIIDGELFAEMVREGARSLSKKKSIVNGLNVFPIPDGDTGDNMYLTVNSGASSAADSRGSLGEVSENIARSMLLGARGNSGVILSRIFAGISKGFAGVESADVEAFSKAMVCGINEAYASVSKPVEGTILTVYREAVEFANSNISPDSTLESYFGDLCVEMQKSLERTPELLNVLREAGVVDSGGAGLVYIAEGMKDALDGKITEDAETAVAAAPKADLDLFTENSVLEFGYCTEFLLRLQSSKVNLDTFDEKVFFDWLNANGESVVAFRDGSIIKVHVHTHTPGKILDEGQKYGEFLTLKIENMTLQHNETVSDKKSSEALTEDKLRFTPHKKYATVAVASGEGVRNMFRELGVDALVEGGQSMNPSADDFVRAFSSLNADNIIVFPNNGNVILTARQAASLYTRANITVIPTKDIGQGYISLSMLDVSSGDNAEIYASLCDTAESTVTGMVSVASRNACMDGVNVTEGQYIGFSDGKILTADENAEAAAANLADRLNAGEKDLIILLCGDKAEKSAAENLAAELEKKYPSSEVILTGGGQPIYDYIIVLS